MALWGWTLWKHVVCDLDLHFADAQHVQEHEGS